MYQKALSLALLPIIAIQSIGSVSLANAAPAKSSASSVTRPVSTIIALGFVKPSVTISRGSTATLSVYAYMSNGGVKYVTNDSTITYTSSNSRMVSVAAGGKITAGTDVPANYVATITATASNGISTTSTVTVIGKEDLVVTPGQVDLKAGESAQIQAKVTYSDGRSLDVTSGGKVTYQSMDASLATVDAFGLITATASSNSYANKGVEIRVTAGELQLVRTVFVRIVNTSLPIVIEDLVMTPETDHMGAGQSQQLTLQFMRTDGQIVDVTTNSKTTYVSSNPAVVSVSTSGFVTVASNLADDTAATVTATYMGSTNAPNGLSRSVLIKVGVADIRGISVTPKSFSMNAVGATQQLKVETVRADGTKAEDVTAKATAYSSNNTNVLDVDAYGKVTVPSNAYWCGTKSATITITNGSWSTTAKGKVTLTNGCVRKK